MKIKKITWRHINDGRDHWVSAQPWRCDYWINHPINGRGEGAFLASFSDYAGDPWSEVFATLEQAMAACQSHHEAKVMLLIDAE